MNKPLRTECVGMERWHDDWARALDGIGQFDLVISEKLHVSITAACRCVPFVALNYRSKVIDFCRSISWENFCVNIERLDPATLLEHVAVLAGSRNDYALELSDKVGTARTRLLGAVDRAAASLLPGLGAGV